MGISGISQTDGLYGKTVNPAPGEEKPVSARPATEAKAPLSKDGMDSAQVTARREKALKVAGATSSETQTIEEARRTCGALNPYSTPSLQKFGPYVGATRESFAEVSSEQARSEFESMRAKVAQNMGIDADAFQYDDRYFSNSFPQGTTDLSKILEKGEIPSIAAGYDPVANKITISRGTFALKDSDDFRAMVRISGPDGKEKDFGLAGKDKRDKFVAFSFVHEGVHYLRNKASQAEFTAKARNCDVELHLRDPKDRDTTHPVTAEELYKEEVQVNSIAAAYYFNEAGVSESVKNDLRGLPLQ